MASGGHAVSSAGLSIPHVSSMDFRKCRLVPWTCQVGLGKPGTVLHRSPSKSPGSACSALAWTACPLNLAECTAPAVQIWPRGRALCLEGKGPLMNLTSGRWVTPHSRGHLCQKEKVRLSRDRAEINPEGVRTRPWVMCGLYGLWTSEKTDLLMSRAAKRKSKDGLK